MFTKLMISEKVSSTVCQGLWKEQKQNSDVYQTEFRKENADDYHAIEKAKEQKELELGSDVYHSSAPLKNTARVLIL